RSPEFDLASYVIDQGVLLTPLAGHIEVQRLLDAVILPARWHGNERLTRPTTVEHLAGRPVRPNLEVLRWRVVRRVEDWIGEIGVRHRETSTLTSYRVAWPDQLFRSSGA